MGEIHSLSDGTKLAVFEERNQIRMMELPFRRGSGPAILRQDCLKDLTSVLYRGRIYYAYHSLEHRVIFGAVGERAVEAVLSDPSDSCQYTGLKLVAWREKLWLFFCAYSQTEKTWSVRVLCPLESRAVHSLWEGMSSLPEPRYVAGDALLILAGERVRLWDGEGMAEAGKFLRAAEGKRIRELVLKLQEENQSYVQRLDVKTGELAETEAQIRKLAAQKNWYENRLEQLKHQYEELAEFAKELQAEGKRWREKYYRRQK